MSILDEIFSTKRADEWLKILIDAGVPCSPINTLDRALSDPQTLHRDMVVTVDYTGGGQIRQVGNPVKMSETPKQVYKSSPTLGQHTEEILSGLLGYSKEKIDKLRKEKVI